MKKLFALSAALVLTACAAPALAPVESTVNVTGRVIELPAAARYSLATADSGLRVPFQLKRLDHIDVYLTNTTDAAAAVKIGKLDPLDDTSDTDRSWSNVKLTNLKPRTNYTVTLRGFQTNPETGNVEEVTAGSITRTGAATDDFTGSTTTFTTKYSDSDYTGASQIDQYLDDGFNLKLADQAFAGTAEGSIENDDGKLIHDGASETLEEILGT